MNPDEYGKCKPTTNPPNPRQNRLQYLMKHSHINKLRGGWKWLSHNQSQPIALPCTTLSLAEIAPEITLLRRFQHPPVQSTHQIVRLFATQISGTSRIELDGQPLSAQSLQQGHPLTNQPHQLTLTLDTTLTTPAQEWGLVWISIEQ